MSHILGKPAVTWIEGGGIQLEWDVEGRHLEIEVCGTDTLLCLTEQEDGTLDTYEIPLGPSDAVDSLRKLFDWLFETDVRVK